MSEIVSLAAQRKGDPELAARIREFADRIESGEIRDAVVVFHDKGNHSFCSTALYQDRWRLLGALEYAKGLIHEQP